MFCCFLHKLNPPPFFSSSSLLLLLLSSFSFPLPSCSHLCTPPFANLLLSSSPRSLAHRLLLPSSAPALFSSTPPSSSPFPSYRPPSFTYSCPLHFYLPIHRLSSVFYRTTPIRVHCLLLLLLCLPSIISSFTPPAFSPLPLHPYSHSSLSFSHLLLLTTLFLSTSLFPPSVFSLFYFLLLPILPVPFYSSFLLSSTAFPILSTNCLVFFFTHLFSPYNFSSASLLSPPLTFFPILFSSCVPPHSSSPFFFSTILSVLIFPSYFFFSSNSSIWSFFLFLSTYSYPFLLPLHCSLHRSSPFSLFSYHCISSSFPHLLPFSFPTSPPLLIFSPRRPSTPPCFTLSSSSLPLLLVPFPPAAALHCSSESNLPLRCHHR